MANELFVSKKNVEEIVQLLLPETELMDDQLISIYKFMADAMIDETIDEKYINYGKALLVLDMIEAQDSNVVRNKIGNVEVEYSGEAGRGKWKKMYNALVDGAPIDEKSLVYQGI